jgi:hypothetical protein
MEQGSSGKEVDDRAGDSGVSKQGVSVGETSTDLKRSVTPYTWISLCGRLQSIRLSTQRLDAMSANFDVAQAIRDLEIVETEAREARLLLTEAK